MQVGLGPGHIVLRGDQAPPPPKGHSPQIFGPICCGQTAAFIKMPLGMDVGLSPGDFVLDGDPVPPPKKGAEPPNFRPVFIVAKRLDGSLGTKVGLNPGDSVLDGDPAPSTQRGWSPSPLLGPFLGGRL